MLMTSDGVHLMQLYDVHEEPTQPYCLKTIADRVVDEELLAEVFWAYQHDMRTRPTLPLDRDMVQALRSLANEPSDDEVTPIMTHRRH